MTHFEKLDKDTQRGVIDGVLKALVFLSTVDSATGAEMQKAAGLAKTGDRWVHVWRLLHGAALVEHVPTPARSAGSNPAERWELSNAGASMLWIMMAAKVEIEEAEAAREAVA